MLSSRGSSQARDRTWVSGIQVDSLPSEPPRKPLNTEVGSLSLLQGNFLTQELNLGLLQCCWILYQLSYQGNLGFPDSCLPSLPLSFEATTLSCFPRLSTRWTTTQ